MHVHVKSTALISSNAMSATALQIPPIFGHTFTHITDSQERGFVLQQVLLNRLRASAGKWHELANLVPVLSTLGIDNTIIEAETGIERAQLNAWLVSVQVGHILHPELWPAM
jgi:hypothetical protein